jgi:hypothetical protein
MGWTDPRTWVTDELVTAAIMNTHVRDNFNSLLHLQIRKPADESVASSTTLQNDDDLQLTLASNGVYQVYIVMILTGGAGAANSKVAFTFPSGCQIYLGKNYYDVGGVNKPMRWNTSTSPSGSNDIIVGAVGELVPIHGVVINGSTAGTLILQWAQNTSNATATVMKANSTLWAAKIA